MGYGMAKNLRKKTSKAGPLILCEIDPQRQQQFIGECGGKHAVRVADSPKQVAETADIIITMLPQAEHVRDVFTNPETGLLAAGAEAAASPKLLIDCSSIATSTSTTLGLSVKEKSNVWSFIDAPVSGGPAGAEAGTLTFMVSGSRELFNQALPVLAMMGISEHIYHCGGPGAGLATKQLNNYLAYVGYLALCEVMNTGILYGLDPKTLSDVINASSGMNWNSLHQNPVKGVNPDASSARGFKGGFTTELAGGVIDDAVELMQKVGCRTVLAKPTQAIFAAARQSELCSGMEARSVWRLFVEQNPVDELRLADNIAE